MVDVETLRGLLAKVEASEPTRELDVAIAQWLYESGAANGLVNYDPEMFVIRHGGFVDELNACVGVFEATLPGWSRESGRSGFGNPAWCHAWNPLKAPGPGNTIKADHHGGCEALAIIACTLRVLIAQAETDHADA